MNASIDNKPMKGCYLIILVSVLGTCLNANAQYTPKREMRAVWIATVENIDWPSKPGLTSADQQREMTELLDLVKAYHLNTVVLQIRPVADAFYPSSIEPWSHYLTGEQGKAPDPFYDPLAFTIAECRKRGLDIHVWLNPYRALRDTAVNLTAPDHITRTHPEWFVTYGSTVY
ncbi:MAG: family 10 glycosylhydrolase, partial [Bacteroidales bacterium]|nr:family 10 glycosylhydrolase [Bacteroidales bacterium]